MSNIELYQLNSQKRYFNGRPHTDSVSFIDDIDEKKAEKLIDEFSGVVVYDNILFIDEYNNTINANSSYTEDKENFPKDGVRVIIIENPAFLSERKANLLEAFLFGANAYDKAILRDYIEYTEEYEEQKELYKCPSCGKFVPQEELKCKNEKIFCINEIDQ